MNEWRFPAWDPVFLEIRDPIHLRWYGVMFLCAFLAGQWVLQRLARARFLPLPEQRVGDFLFWLVLGVLLGGRLGYSLFYSPHLWSNPLDVLKVWEGGLSFHGGLIGVCLAFLWYARRHGADPWRLGDGCALGTPIGVACVRFANFINGELWGRVIDDPAQAPPWAMRFPTEDRALELLGIAGWASKREQELAVQKAVHGPWPGMPAKLEAVPDWDAVKDQVPLRHPSQLYEMLGEGVLLGVLLWLLYRATRHRPLGSGVYGGLFLLGYGCVRFVVEWYRQPDKQFEKDGRIGTVWLGLSMGQLLCAGMIAAGGAIVALRWNRGRDGGAAQPPAQPEPAEAGGA